eukprot:5550970-Prymnesium_polylepis.1
MRHRGCGRVGGAATSTASGKRDLSVIGSARLGRALAPSVRRIALDGRLARHARWNVFESAFRKELALSLRSASSVF